VVRDEVMDGMDAYMMARMNRQTTLYSTYMHTYISIDVSLPMAANDDTNDLRHQREGLVQYNNKHITSI